MNYSVLVLASKFEFGYIKISVSQTSMLVVGKWRKINAAWMDDMWSQSVEMVHVKEMGFPLQYYKSIVCATGFNSLTQWLMVWILSPSSGEMF